MRNLNPRSFEELSEAIVRHLANQPSREVGVLRPTEKTNERGDSDLRLLPTCILWERVESNWRLVHNERRSRWWSLDVVLYLMDKKLIFRKDQAIQDTRLEAILKYLEVAGPN